jgi:hypothetical protein
MVQKRPSQPGRRDGRVGGNRIGVTRLHAGQTNAQPTNAIFGPIGRGSEIFGNVQARAADRSRVNFSRMKGSFIRPASASASAFPNESLSDPD